MWFEAFREPGWNTYYGGRSSVARVDITQVFVFFFTVVLALVMLVLVIGSKGREKWTTFLRVLFSLHTGVVIIVCLTGQTWQVASTKGMCEYMSSDPQKVFADIGVVVGLRSVNITLKGEFNESTAESRSQIYYNERFSFNKVSDMHDSFEEARERGLPWSILYVLEYFRVDQGGLRWCRHFRQSGYFAFIMLWSAFAAWAVANLHLGFAVIRGASMFVVSGVLMLAANVLYHFLQPGFPLRIPFHDTVIELSYGWSFWLCLLSGTCTVVSGLAVMLLHWWSPMYTAAIFLHDELQQDMEEQEMVVEKDSQPLNIGTPRTMRRELSRCSKRSMAFDEGSDSPPPYAEDKQKGARGVRGSRSCGMLNTTTEENPGNMTVFGDRQERLAKVDIHQNGNVEFVIGIAPDDEDINHSNAAAHAVIGRRESCPIMPSRRSSVMPLIEEEESTAESGCRSSRKASMPDVYTYSDRSNPGKEEEGAYAYDNPAAVYEEVCETVNPSHSVSQVSVVEANDTADSNASSNHTTEDTTSDVSSVNLKYSEEDGVSKAIIQIKDSDWYGSTNV